MIKYCPHCETHTHHDFIYEPPSLWIPALLTVVTFGWFLPFYLIYMLFTWGRVTEAQPYCSMCGERN